MYIHVCSVAQNSSELQFRITLKSLVISCLIRKRVLHDCIGQRLTSASKVTRDEFNGILGSEQSCVQRALLHGSVAEKWRVLPRMHMNIQGVSKRALKLYSKCYCVASVTNAFALQGVQNMHRSKPRTMDRQAKTYAGG
jgi:hypothetical protein